MTRVVKPTGKMAAYADTQKGDPFLAEMKKVALAEFAGEDDHWDDKGIRTIHASEMSKTDWCPRATFLRIKTGLRPEEEFNFVRENMFGEGHFIHEKWQRRMRKTGKLWGTWTCKPCGAIRVGTEPGLEGCKYDFGHMWQYQEVQLDCEGTHLIAGHADGAMVPANHLVEIKSIAIGTLRVEAPKLLEKYYVETKSGKKIYDVDGLWKDIRKPFSGHVRQANIYLWMARELGMPFDHMKFLYESKNNQVVKVYTIRLSERILRPLLEQAARIKYALDNGEDLPCEHGGCKECQAMEERIRGANGQPPQRDAATGLSQPGGEAEAGAPEVAPVRVGRTTRRRRSTPAAQGNPPVTDASSDGAVPPVQRVAAVPGDPARGGRGRRTVRRRQSR